MYLRENIANYIIPNESTAFFRDRRIIGVKKLTADRKISAQAELFMLCRFFMCSINKQPIFRQIIFASVT